MKTLLGIAAALALLPASALARGPDLEKRLLTLVEGAPEAQQPLVRAIQAHLLGELGTLRTLELGRVTGLPDLLMRSVRIALGKAVAAVELRPGALDARGVGALRAANKLAVARAVAAVTSAFDGTVKKPPLAEFFGLLLVTVENAWVRVLDSTTSQDARLANVRSFWDRRAAALRGALRAYHAWADELGRDAVREGMYQGIMMLEVGEEPKS